MRRRTFLQIPAVSTVALGAPDDPLPSYRVVSTYKPVGTPNKYPGRVVAVRAEKSIDAQSEEVDRAVVREMIDRGIRALTGAAKPADAWRAFISPQDVVAIKVNCSGSPNILSTREVVWEIARNLVEIGVGANQIYVYERFPDQLQNAKYASGLPEGTQIHAAEQTRRSLLGYDAATYVEVDFFGEEDTRSNMVKLITEKITKIINVPNMKDHGASGVTGCLKNMAYGSFHNVARSHRSEKTHTYSFIGTLAGVEPLRSRTVLHVMDGLRGVWHAGPFSTNRRFRFYPKQMMFGTDPVSIDRLLIDIIDNKRKAEGAISVWDRSKDKLDARAFRSDPNRNSFIREPGHIEYASKLGLGTYALERIRLEEITL